MLYFGDMEKDRERLERQIKSLGPPAVPVEKLLTAERFMPKLTKANLSDLDKLASAVADQRQALAGVSHFAERDYTKRVRAEMTANPAKALELAANMEGRTARFKHARRAVKQGLAEFETERCLPIGCLLIEKAIEVLREVLAEASEPVRTRLESWELEYADEADPITRSVRYYIEYLRRDLAGNSTGFSIRGEVPGLVHPLLRHLTADLYPTHVDWLLPEDDEPEPAPEDDEAADDGEAFETLDTTETL